MVEIGQVDRQNCFGLDPDPRAVEMPTITNRGGMICSCSSARPPSSAHADGVDGHRGYLPLARHVKISAYRRQFESTPHGRGAALFRKSPAIYLNRGVKDIFIACVDGLKHVVLPFILRMKVAQGRTDRPWALWARTTPRPPRRLDRQRLRPSRGASCWKRGSRRWCT